MSIYISSARTTELGTQTDNPFIGYSNFGALSTTVLSGAATLTDGAAANAMDGTTFDYWLPNVSGSVARLQIALPAPQVVSLVGIAAHNIRTLSASVQVQRSIDGGANWSDAGAGVQTPTDNDAIVFRMTTNVSNAAANWRIGVSGLTTSDPLYIGVALFGVELLFPERFFDGYSPPITPTEVQLQSNVAVGGNLLGSSVISQGSTISTEFSYMSPAFVRGEFKTMASAFNKGDGIFFGWRPSRFPSDVHYCWRNGGTLRPVNAGGLDKMSASFSAQVFEA